MALGLAVPQWVALRFAEVVGHYHAERMLPLGLQVSPQDAKAINLVDEITADEEMVCLIRNACLNVYANYAAAAVNRCCRVRSESSTRPSLVTLPPSA